MTNEISIAVTGMTAVQTEGPGAVVSDNTGYRVRFRFDEIWRKCGTVTALFLREDGACYPPVMLTLSAQGEAVCSMPAVNGTPFIRIGAASGSTGNGEGEPELYTTSAAEIPVVSSVRELSGQILDTPPADVWSTVTELIGKCGEKLKEMTGASASEPGKAGLVPAPLAGDEGKVLFGSGTWGDLPEAGGSSGAAKPWRQIRSLTVPAYADVGSDATGVTWLTSSAGVLGAEFDTDDNGEAFEVSEFALYLMGNWVSTGNLILRANDNKMLVNLKENLGTDTQFGFYWLRKLGKTWCTESTVGPQNRFRYENLPVYRSGFQSQAIYPFESITKIKVECSVAFAGSGAVIEVWGR